MKNFDGYIADLKQLISINSVSSTAEENAPFGKNTLLALEKFLSLAKGYGFNTINYDNYIGEIYIGEGEELGVIGHVDIVPAGVGWETDPFVLTKKNEYYYGRGVGDDKGPLLLVLHVLKDLRDEGIKFNKKIRLFVGCDEEKGWRDVEHLKKVTNLPKKGFSPDGDFPVIYAEKGVLNTYFYLPLLKNFYDLSGGTVINAVCAKASCKAKKEGINISLIKKYNLTLDGNTITSTGISAHGSAPSEGKNALEPLFRYFLEMGEDVQDFVSSVFDDKYKLTQNHNEQGYITMSPDVICEENGKIKIATDIRVPAPFTFDFVKNILDKFNVEYIAVDKHPPFLIDKNGWFIQTLISSYNKATGENAKPISMCGSTFGRVFSEGCSFGIEFLGDSNHVHQPNERISETTIKKAYNVYYLALKNLVE